jgi:hypothetical protein
MYSTIDPQLQSMFFAAPAEIRYAILIHVVPETIHLSINEGGPQLSPCIQRDRDDDPNCWNQRRNNNRHFSIPKYQIISTCPDLDHLGASTGDAKRLLQRRVTSTRSLHSSCSSVSECASMVLVIAILTTPAGSWISHK